MARTYSRDSFLTDAMQTWSRLFGYFIHADEAQVGLKLLPGSQSNVTFNSTCNNRKHIILMTPKRRFDIEKNQ